MDRALVIVDMQNRYSKIGKKVLYPVCELVKHFQQYPWMPIINVRFQCKNNGYRHADMLSPLDEILDVSSAKHVWKNNMDGSDEVDLEIQHYNNSPKHNKIQRVIICGVNTTECVAATAFGLKRLGYAISIMEDCCADFFDEAHKLQMEAWKIVSRFHITESDLLSLDTPLQRTRKMDKIIKTHVSGGANG